MRKNTCEIWGCGIRIKTFSFKKYAKRSIKEKYMFLV